MSETTSTDIRRSAKAIYLAAPESVAKEIERQLLAGADAMDRLAEAESLLREALDRVNDCIDAEQTSDDKAGDRVNAWLERIDAFLPLGVKGKTMMDLDQLKEVRQSGYLGILPNGNLVDRRDYPEAMPMPKNKLLDTPEPKPIPPDTPASQTGTNPEK